MFSDKWLAHGYFTVPGKISQCFHMFPARIKRGGKNMGEDHPVTVFFFCSHLFAPSPRSERVAQSIRRFTANGSNEETQRVYFNWKYRWHHLTNFGYAVNGTA